jgi:quercetin 2,3-dioxygenase
MAGGPSGPAEEDEIMMQLFPANDRFATKINWLNSKHSFSFGHHYDPNRMGYRNLRVINDDIVAPASGFPMHGHADMEIVTYILDGSLEHKDSIGTGSVIRPGDAQRMSAGTGIRHSEFNPSQGEGVHLLQIWIEPAQEGLAPSYEQKALQPADGRLVPVATPDGRDGSVTIHANAAIHARHRQRLDPCGARRPGHGQRPDALGRRWPGARGRARRGSDRRGRCADRGLGLRPRLTVKTKQTDQLL